MAEAQQLNYEGIGKDAQTRGLHGDIATTRPYTKRARVYAKVKHTQRIAIGSATAGDHTITISTPAGQLPVSPVEVTIPGGGDVDTLGAALATAVNANADLKNVLRATADSDNDRVDLAAIRSGEGFTVALTVNPGGDFTATTLLESNQSRLPLGLAVVDVDGEVGRIPTTGDVERQILGLFSRGKQIGANRDGSAEGHTPGAILEVLVDGDIFLLDNVETEMAVGDQVFVRVVATGNEVAGSIRNDADGGDAVAKSRWRVLQGGGPTSGKPMVLAVYP